MKQQVIIIGAGASGLMCAIEAAKRGKNVLVIDHANKVGKKILMSGGGRCNFTNYYVAPEKFLSQNAHFCKSALTRYTQWDFISLVERYQLQYHEKTLGQLFCNGKSKEIVDILLDECKAYNITIKLNTKVTKINKNAQTENFSVTTNDCQYLADKLVIATGGLSIPTMGASGFGYDIAREFGLKVLPTRAALVPFVLSEKDKRLYSELAGVSVFANVSCNQMSFEENILFTHRGLSGPAILQISSFWQPKDHITVTLRPDIALVEYILKQQKEGSKQQLKTILESVFPKRLVSHFVDEKLLSSKIAALKAIDIQNISDLFQKWQIMPCSTEGYRTAEVTLGGVSTDEISSKTFESNKVKGLYFIGEVLDVTGWLGGYNFQWAWASGWAAAQAL
ncbi:NAD(P)/FAD-dependent oxidoreductase [Fangia hongkongensis]|uniref:NAD(P)/FAD-dependent oxidoreductase n=1 Tax=Fangia hongkongensis TaxID=270495 RepID=UPI000367F2AB|nr:NAD(P)/FAD-dependent oxidoreductase [Fangia hongkongensis]MBK2125933.1 NAD(P)/FAD-dependent oxidoreductase [Fangia hongkongensis]